MDMAKFQALGLSTEAPITDELTKRLVRAYPIYSDLLSETVNSGEFLDRIKKYIFYGKQDGLVEDQLPPVWPTGEKKERIQQLARVLHGLIGIGTEHGELAEEIIDYIEGNKSDLDTNHIAEEVFDIIWYLNVVLHVIGMNIPMVCEKGIAKLRERFPKRFTEQDAEHRDTKKEMEAFINVEAFMKP